MRQIKFNEVIEAMLDEMSPQEIAKLTPEEMKRACCEIADEIACARMEEEQDSIIHGDPEHERYLMSEEYEADRKQEQWDWIKNA